MTETEQSLDDTLNAIWAEWSEDQRRHFCRHTFNSQTRFVQMYEHIKITDLEFIVNRLHEWSKRLRNK